MSGGSHKLRPVGHSLRPIAPQIQRVSQRHPGCIPTPIMLLALIPGVLSIVLFVATLSLKPTRARATVLPPQPLPR